MPCVGRPTCPATLPWAWRFVVAVKGLKAIDSPRGSADSQRAWLQGAATEPAVSWLLQGTESRADRDPTLTLVSCLSQKSREDVSNFDPDFIKEEPVLTPMDEAHLPMINQDEFRNFSYMSPELQP